MEQLTREPQKERSLRLELTEQFQQQQDTHQQELETEKQSHTERVRVDQELVRGLRDKQDALRQELESLEARLEELTSTNLKLATKLQAEEEVSQALQREIAQLNEELREQVEESLTVLQALELVPEPEVSEKKEVLGLEKSQPLPWFEKEEQGEVGEGVHIQLRPLHLHGSAPSTINSCVLQGSTAVAL